MRELTDQSGRISYTYVDDSGKAVMQRTEARWALPTVSGVPVEQLVTGVALERARGYRDAGLWTGSTHWEFLQDTVKKHAESAAATDSYRSVSWQELNNNVYRAAAQLSKQGVSAGDFVVVQLPNSVAFMETIFALWKLGAVPIFSLVTHGALDIEHCITQTHAHYYVGEEHLTPHLRTVSTMVDDMESVKRIRVPVSSATPWGDQPLESLDSPTHHALASELAFIQLSGGTTGLPKLIPKTHDDYLYSVRASVQRCALSQEDVTLIVLPASHNFTMSSPGILGSVQVGAHSVFASGTLPTDIAKDCVQHNVTHMALVPPLLLSILNSSSEVKKDCSGVKTLWVGGAKLSQAAATRVHSELGCILTQVFGMAEGLVNYTYLPGHAPEGMIPEEVEWESIHTQGHPVSSWDEVRVLNAHGRECLAGEAGDLYTRGPYTIQRYFNPRYQDSFTHDGFYRTGDIVVRTPTGALTVVGRSKEQINRGGEKISPELVENVLLLHPDIHNVSVVGVPDELLGEKIRAYVIPRNSIELSARALRKFVKQQGLSAYAVPDFIEFVEDFPLTAVGKISKKDQRTE